MDAYRVSLRVIHIIGGIYWAGTTFTLVVFRILDVGALSMEKLPERVKSYGRASNYAGVAAVLNVISSFLLYWYISSGFRLGWATSSQGLILTVSALAGTAAFLMGALIISRNDNRILAIKRIKPDKIEHFIRREP